MFRTRVFLPHNTRFIEDYSTFTYTVFFFFTNRKKIPTRESSSRTSHCDWRRDAGNVGRDDRIGVFGGKIKGFEIEY